MCVAAHSDICILCDTQLFDTKACALYLAVNMDIYGGAALPAPVITCPVKLQHHSTTPHHNKRPDFVLCNAPQMVSSSRAWAGMSHQAVVKAVCIDKLQLQFPADAPEALVALGQACMAYDPAERPTLEDILEVLAPLNEFIVSAEINAMRPGARSVMRNGVVNNV